MSGNELQLGIWLGHSFASLPMPHHRDAHNQSNDLTKQRGRERERESGSIGSILPLGIDQ